jgi:hypothetical protein
MRFEIMAKIIKFDNSIENFLKRAEDMLAIEDVIGAISYIGRALDIDSDNVEANLLLADLYNSLSLLDNANQVYFNLISRNKNIEALQCLITNLMQMGDFTRAKYYNDKYDVDFDFSTQLGGRSEFSEEEDAYDDEPSSPLKLVVSRSRAGGENKVKEEIPDIAKLWEQLANLQAKAARSEAPAEKAFKQVYPRTNKECEGLLEKGVELLMQGRHGEALVILSQIEKNNIKQYYEAQKCCAMCNLALGKYSDMLMAVDEAMKGKPDDYSLKCYRYIALKLLDEPFEAENALSVVLTEKPQTTMDLMNKLDVCRLAEYHAGVLENSLKVLEQLPYHPIFMVLYGKAQFNTGDKKGAIFTLKTVKKLFPEMWEPEILLERIEKYNVDRLSYSDIETTIKRVKTLSEINLSVYDTHDFAEYLRGYDGAKRKLQFVLSGDVDVAYGKLLASLGGIYSAELRKVYDRVLMDVRVGAVNKKGIISSIILARDESSIKALFGNFYKEVKIKPLAECDKLPKVLEAAYALCFAEYLANENRYEAVIAELTDYVNRLISVIDKMGPEDWLYAELSGLRSADMLKTVLYERVKLSVNKQNKVYLKEVGGSTYVKYKNVLKQLEERYESD